MLKRYKNRPAHLFIDNASYFITASIYQKRQLLNDALKTELITLLHQTFSEFSWTLEHWVVLPNHYHLMAQSHKAEDLPKILGRVHYLSGQKIRKAYPSDSPVWLNYWDYCPRDEKDYLAHLNYLLYNPVKHGLVTDLHDYPFSSFHQSLGKLGRENLRLQFSKNPEYKNLSLPEDDF